MAEETAVAEEETEEATEAATATETEAETAETKDEPDYKALARKNDNKAKALAKRAEAAEKRLAEREDEDKSEQEKALEAARKEAADAARSEVTGAVRKKLLRAEVKALAAGKFADPDDAVKLLDVDDEDAFDEDGEVQVDALKTALDALLEAKPHLAAGAKTPGDSDAGKGSGAGKSYEEMSVEEHHNRIRRHRE